MSNIPEARSILRGVARDLRAGTVTRHPAAAAISQAMPMLVRAAAARRAPRAKRYVTKGLIAQIKAFASVHPLMHLDDIAKHFGVNPGRVSEVLNGKR